MLPRLRRRWLQFRLRTLLLLLAAVATVLAVFVTPQAWERYRFRRFNDALYAKVKPGDSIQLVQDALGDGQPAADDEIANYRKMNLNSSDGFEATDEILVWH